MIAKHENLNRQVRQAPRGLHPVHVPRGELSDVGGFVKNLSVDYLNKSSPLLLSSAFGFSSVFGFSSAFGWSWAFFSSAFGVAAGGAPNKSLAGAAAAGGVAGGGVVAFGGSAGGDAGVAGFSTVVWPNPGGGAAELGPAGGVVTLGAPGGGEP